MHSVDAQIVKHLPAVRDSPAFDLRLHLKAPAGISVVLGPSGSGKTLLLNCLGGFVRPDEGRILVQDELYFDAATNVHVSPHRRRCGYIFQDHALFPHMTVRENLRFASSLPPAGAKRLNRHRRINELLETFDLTELSDRRPAQLSGGQKQRAALARILITDPRMLLLDEPSRGLDSLLRQSFWDLLRSIRTRLAVPILLVSHDLDETFELADFVIALHAGKLLQAGDRDELLQRPANLEFARLLGVYNIAPVEILALDPVSNLSRLRLLNQELLGPYFPGHLIGDSGYLCIRRSEVRIEPLCREAAKDQLTLRIESKHSSVAGIRLVLEGGFSILIDEAENAAYAADQHVTIRVPATAMAITGK